MLKIGINGFGRIGRAIFRINYNNNVFNVVAINDINPSNENLAYMLKYDSTYGLFNADINTNSSSLLINDADPIDVYHKETICEVPWEKHSVDIIIDASGVYENLLHKSHHHSLLNLYIIW